MNVFTRPEPMPSDPAQSGADDRRVHNWSDTYTFRAPRIERPTTRDAVRQLVAAASRVRAIGTCHSFNDLADSPGCLIDLSALPYDLRIAPDGRTATVGGSIPYGVLAGLLHDAGYALHNMGSLPHISVAGATATGTHGSGDGNGSLATAVAALELVTADGELLTIRRDEPGFEAIAVGLGAFGVITRVTLDIQPSFQVRQDAFADLPWPALLDNFDAIMGAAYSVSVMTPWSGETVRGIWLKTRTDQAGRQAQTADDLAALIGASLANHVVAIGADTDPTYRLNVFGAPGPWSQRLPHFRIDRDPGATDQIQSEYMVPRRQAVAALKALRGMADRIDRLLRLTELRTVAADRLWLSSSYGEPVLAIHFTWLREPGPVAEITAEIEDVLLPLGARPHWGKLIHADAARLAPLYPRMQDFREFATRLDPGGKFRNAYLDRHVFG